MLKIQQDISLRAFNTFGIDVKAQYFAEAHSLDELIELLSGSQFKERLVLGGGSNILLVNDIDAMVIHVGLKGIEVVSETEDVILIKAAAGENWHEFVLWCLEHNCGGIENLSLIPGNVGTAPIQNIGAYGVELKDVFVSCEALNRETLQLRSFSKEDCDFGYRNSFFKQEGRDKYVITSVTLRLTKKEHRIHLEYGAIKQQLKTMGVTTPTIQDVSRAVIAIRRSKLPDPAQLGNAGSFFKNPVIDKAYHKKLVERFPTLPYYTVSENKVKIPAGWLVEKAGFKGMRKGDAGVHQHQALVLVNYGDASGKELWQLSQRIQATVKRLFGIELEAEVNVLP